MKKLYRSENNRIVAGVLGGLGEHVDVDPTIIRLVFIFITFFTGIVPGVLAYLVALFVVPKKNKK